ncbi:MULTISPECIES: carbonic anhydrase [Atlantibacter]|uniref:carbonic anhydrase n=1 Tax=Atlantibacter TaxID=1903434 RepID=UPI0022B79BD4|nr:MULTISPECIES: carbonic anhydrase family protein [Atlantibacter]MCZ7836015.1 carbonic anhydrase family protein [Atlantibacter hermannii]
MKMRLAKSLLIAAGLTPVLALASHWSYEGHGSPEHWGELSNEFKECQAGKNQSPIDITSALDAHIAPLDVHYSQSPVALLNNGHTVQASFDQKANNIVDFDNIKVDLQQFHFHAPSENTINGKHAAMEMHLVHKENNGDVVVVAVMFNIGAENPALTALWKQMPQQAEKSAPLTTKIDMNTLLPADKTYWRFSGSLTTPPCSEGVTWLVMKHPLTLSEAQLQQFKAVMHHDNNRPVQPLHGRVVVE